MNDYKELISSLRSSAKLQAYYVHTAAENTNDYKAADAIEQLLHERFVIGETLVAVSKWEIEPTDALEKIRKVLRGEI